VTILIDTNVLSEFRKIGSGKADRAVVEWQSQFDSTTFYVSAISIMELELGILLIERRDGMQGAVLRAWMNERVVPEFSGRILPIDTTIARRCARLHVPDPRPERDALIAATALVHGMTLATRNTADFYGIGLLLTNPWLAAEA
jgi:predicted nucleic acid-binding protein